MIQTAARQHGPSLALARSDGSLRGLPRESNHPVFDPSFAAIHGAVTLPVGRPPGDPGPPESRENLVPSLVLPLAVKIYTAAFKSSAPDLEATGRRSVRPRMFPLGGLRIKGAEPEALDNRSLIRSLEEFQGNAAIQNLGRLQPSWTLAPGSIGQRKAADSVPFAFQKIKPLCLRVRGFGNHITQAGLQIRSPRIAGDPSPCQPNLTRIVVFRNSHSDVLRYSHS